MADESSQDWSPLITGGLVLALGVLATIAFLGRQQQPLILLAPAGTSPVPPQAQPSPDPAKAQPPSAKPEPVDPTELNAWLLPEDDGMWGMVDVRLDRPNGMSFWRGEVDAPTPQVIGAGLSDSEDAPGSLDWLTGLLDFAFEEGYRKITIHTPTNISRPFRDWIFMRLSEVAANIAAHNETGRTPYPLLFWAGTK